jgi:anaerobic selenocysteine-containing dehydrogenase
MRETLPWLYKCISKQKKLENEGTKITYLFDIHDCQDIFNSPVLQITPALTCSTDYSPVQRVLWRQPRSTSSGKIHNTLEQITALLQRQRSSNTEFQTPADRPQNKWDKFRYNTIKKNPRKEKNTQTSFKKIGNPYVKIFLRNSTTTQHRTLTEQSTTTRSNTLQSSQTPLRALEETRVLGREGRRAFLIHWMAYFPLIP